MIYPTYLSEKDFSIIVLVLCNIRTKVGGEAIDTLLRPDTYYSPLSIKIGTNSAQSVR